MYHGWRIWVGGRGLPYSWTQARRRKRRPRRLGGRGRVGGELQEVAAPPEAV